MSYKNNSHSPPQEPPQRPRLLASGVDNNLTLAGDLTSRALLCHIDPEWEHPDERTFKRDLRQWVPTNRARLVGAALTILRAHKLAGSPQMGLKAMGRFENWSGWVRAALVWLSEADPCATRKRIVDEDPVRAQLSELMIAWRGEIGVMNATVTEAIRATHKKEGADITETARALGDALRQFGVTASGGINGRVIGNFVIKHAGKIVDGYRFVPAGDGQGGRRKWKLEKRRTK